MIRPLGALVVLVGGCGPPPPLDCPPQTTLSGSLVEGLVCRTADGTPRGPFRRDDPAGEGRVTGRYDEAGRRTGEWETVRPDGARRVETWRAGGMDGPWAEWDAEGHKTLSGRYTAGAKDGLWWDWTADGRPEELTTWDRGRPEGPAVAWHPGGDLARVGHHVAGEKAGLWLTWHEVGGPASAVPYTAGVVDGPLRSWYPGGRPEREAVSVRGRLVSESRWSLGGRLVERRDGRVRESWDPDGHRLRWCRPLDETRDRCETWHPNGVLASRSTLVAGRPEGPVEAWDDRGRPLAPRVYREGRRVDVPPAAP